MTTTMPNSTYVRSSILKYEEGSATPTPRRFDPNISDSERIRLASQYFEEWLERERARERCFLRGQRK